ncbi:MAG: DUF924 domain-containing protein [Alphaproteobacteria bacterium]|jgi:uncharacterized protein (DUF924 family)|nr:DUF924 domain-containing protein [Alphaproteobacteria bacterium]
MSYKDLPQNVSVLDFWFSPEVQPNWFIKDPSFDEEIRNRFLKEYEEIIAKFKDGKVDGIKDARQALSYVIVLDQFSRNMFRDKAEAFATDDLALNIAKYTVEKELDLELTEGEQYNFLYMPYMHSENLDEQEEGIRLFSRIPGNEQTVEFAVKHRDIIARFGRFPHRNVLLGRPSTPEEVDFMLEFFGF